MADVTGGSVAPPIDLMRRIRVLRVRQRIEDIASGLLREAENGEPGDRKHAHIKTRLLLLCAAVPADRWSDRYRLADRARAVYAATSDVLHSRRTYIDIPEVLLREWENVVDELDAVESAISNGHR